MASARSPLKQRLLGALIATPLAPDATTAMDTSQAEELVLPDSGFAALRDDVTRRRRAAIARMPELVANFRAAAARAGTTVHEVANAAEARAAVASLALEHAVRFVVSDGSEAVAEIEALAELQSLGIDMLDGALVRRICAPAKTARRGSRPTPAVQVPPAAVQIFERITRSRHGDPTAAALPAEARRRVSDAYDRARVRVAGDVLAVASTGEIGLLGAEAGDRPHSVPRAIRIIVLGIDKIVPTAEEALALWRARMQAGDQPGACEAIRFIGGSATSADEIHVLLLDNGRSGMRADDAFHDALQCIHCSACSDVCPPLQVVGRERFGHIYTGPIGLVLTPWHHGIPAAGRPQSLCFSCNACEPVCPASIPLPKLIHAVRAMSAAQEKGTIRARLVRSVLEPASSVAPVPAVSGLLRGPLAKMERAVVAPLLAGADWRQLPKLAARPFRARLRRREREGAVLAERCHVLPGAGAIGLRAAYFPGCLVDRYYPEIGEASVRLLQASGCEVVFPPGQRCCGAAATAAGDRPRAIALACQTLDALQGMRVSYIVSSSPACVAALVYGYGDLFRGDAERSSQAAALAARIVNLTDFLYRIGRLPPRALAGNGGRAYTYQDCCKTLNVLKQRDEGRSLASDTAGGDLTDMVDADRCCGFGDVASFDHPTLSRPLTEEKLDCAAGSGAPTLVADDPRCIMHLRGALRGGNGITVRHLAEFLADGLPTAAN